MWADFYTKPLQGAQFRILRALIMGLIVTPEVKPQMLASHPAKIRNTDHARIKATTASLQECVESSPSVIEERQGKQMLPRSRTYADVASAAAQATSMPTPRLPSKKLAKLVKLKSTSWSKRKIE